MDLKDYDLSPEKITESFVWFCFSRLTEEEIEDHIVEYREEFRDDILNEMNHTKEKKKDWDKYLLTKPSSKDFVNEEKKKLDSVWVNKMIKQLGFSKGDYKTIVKDVMKQVVKNDNR